MRSSIRPTQCARLFLRPRAYSTTSAPPPLLSKLRTDLKEAMRAKDANRLAVVRGLLSEVTNANKTSSPITTDLGLLSVVRKRLSSARGARDEASAASRQDLVDKEEAQIALLEEYASSVEVWSEERIAEVVGAAVAKMRDAGEKLGMGEVIKKLLAPGGELDGKPVEKSKVSIAVKRALA